MMAPSAPFAQPFRTNALMPSIMPSSSATKASRTTPPSRTPASRSARTAVIAAAMPPFMSAAPRPWSRPSRTMPANGGTDHCAGSPSVTTSVCPSKMSTGAATEPCQSATTLGRPGAASSTVTWRSSARSSRSTRAAAGASPGSPGRNTLGTATRRRARSMRYRSSIAASAASTARSTPRSTPPSPAVAIACRTGASVDIGCARAPCVVEENALELGEELEAFLGHLPAPNPAPLHAAERDLRLAADRRRVDVHHPGLDVVHEPHDRVGVARVDRRRQAVAQAVHDLEGFLEGPDLDEGEHGSEDLFLRDPVGRPDVAKHGRLHEKPARARSVVQPVAAGQEARPFVPAPLDVSKHGTQLPAVHKRPHRDAVLEPVAYPERPRPVDDEIAHSNRHVAMQHAKARRGAPLAGASKRSLCDPSRGEIQIRIGHDDDGVLAAHLACHLGKPAGRARIDAAAYVAGTRERYRPDLGMIDERRAHVAAGADEHGQDAVRQSRFREDLHKALRHERRQRRGLEQHGVAGHERRGDLPRRLRPG